MAKKSTRAPHGHTAQVQVPEPPALEVPRFWSNPGLRDPDTIIALVLEKPTTVDLARTIATYGVERVASVKSRTRRERSPTQNQWLTTLWQPVLQGVRRAHRSPS
jgi:hypothetical protein